MIHLFDSSVDSIRQGNENIDFVYLGDVLIYPDGYATEIVVEMTASAANQLLSNAVRMGVASNAAQTGKAEIDWGDGKIEHVEAQRMAATQNAEPEGFSHSYNVAGTYRVKVKAQAEVSNIRFSSVTNPSSDYPQPVNSSYLTKIIQVKSSSLTDLNYMFAGQVNCVNMDGDFVLETPKVERMDGTFFGCKAISGLPENLLKQISKIVWMWWTFRDMGLSQIPEKLFANSAGIGNNLTETIDLFRQNPMQVMPKTLFLTCSKLTRFEGMFNACPSVDGRKRKVYKQILDGTQAKNLNWMFYAMNHLNVEKGFIDSSPQVKTIVGMFSNNNYTNQLSDPAVFSQDINEIFPASGYPNVENVNALFYNSLGDQSWISPFMGDAGVFAAKFTNPSLSHSGCFRTGDVFITNVPTGWD